MTVCTFSLLGVEHAVVRLAAEAALPAWAQAAHGVTSITRTPQELSIVCAASVVPDAAAHDRLRVERGWRGIVLHGPFAFDQVGILASIAAPLAQARIGIFAISTFDTDYVFVKDADLRSALAALAGAGHVHAVETEWH